MSSHDELFDSVTAYALGSLPPARAAAVEYHLRDCEVCREEYRVIRPAVTAVAYSAETALDARSGAAASPLLKARVMKRVRGEARRRPPRTWPGYAVAAACLAVAIFTGLHNLSLSGQLSHERAQSAAQAATIADLTAPDSRRRHFAGGEVVTRDGRLYLAMHGLPALADGRVYQAWTLAKGAKSMAPSVTFRPARGVAVLRLPVPAATIVAVGVSVEPEGGSKQPTTKPIAVVSI